MLTQKFKDNKQRDHCVMDKLLSEGWRIAVVWECVIRDADEFDVMVDKLDLWIKSGSSQYFESDYKKT